MTSASPEPRRRLSLGQKLLLLCLGVLGLILIILALLPTIVSLESVKGQLIARAEAVVQRQVDVSQVRLQLFTGLGVGLKQLTVHNPPGWQYPHFVKVDTLSMKVAFLPLLQRKIEVSKIILSDGEVVIERDAQGRMNYADLPQPRATDGNTAPAIPGDDTSPTINPLAALLVSQVSLQNVHVVFADRLIVPGQTRIITARNVQGEVTNLVRNSPIDFDFSTTLLAADRRNVRLHGRLGPVPEPLALDRIPLSATLQAQDVLLDHLAPYIGLDANRTTGALGMEVTMQGTLGGGLDIIGILSLPQGILYDTRGALRLEITSTQATLQTRLTLPHPPDVRLDLHVKRLVFDQPKTTAAVPQPAASSAPASLPAVPLPNLYGTVTIAEGRLPHLQFQQMVADFSCLDGRLDSTQTSHLYGGTFQGQLEANLTQAEPHSTFKMALANVNAGRLLADLTAAKNALLGTLNTKFQGSGQGLTWPAISKTLTGTGTVLITDLTLPALARLPTPTPGLQAVGKIAGFSLPTSLNEHAFDTLQGTFDIVPGQLRTNDVRLSGKEVTAQARGMLGFDQHLDFVGTMFLLDPLAATLGPGAALLRDQEGRVPLPFTVHGTVTQPQIVLHEAYLLELTQKSLRGKVGGQIGTELQNLLQKTLPEKPGGQEPTRPGEEEKAKSQEWFEHTLRGLFKR